jgi:hypothetical protein
MLGKEIENVNKFESRDQVYNLHDTVTFFNFSYI